MPAAVRRRLTWFEKATAQGLLATLEPDGKAKLDAWADHGNEIVQIVRETIDAASSGKSDMALAALDRYLHISVEDNGRLVAPSNMVSHLDPTGTGKARVVVRDDELWLWSEIRWEAERKDRLALLHRQ